MCRTDAVTASDVIIVSVNCCTWLMLLKCCLCLSVSHSIDIVTVLQVVYLSMCSYCNYILHVKFQMLQEKKMVPGLVWQFLGDFKQCKLA